MKTSQPPLQWGRDRAVAELGMRHSRARSSRLLQWGRDRAVAELWKCSRRSWPTTCFNGAATARSRNLANAGAFTRSYSALQWGRDRAVAELQ